MALVVESGSAVIGTCRIGRALAPETLSEEISGCLMLIDRITSLVFNRSHQSTLLETNIGCMVSKNSFGFEA